MSQDSQTAFWIHKSSPLQFQKNSNGSYTTWTVSEAWKLKRDNPAAWRKLPQGLRRQAENEVRRWKESFREAGLYPGKPLRRMTGPAVFVLMAMAGAFNRPRTHKRRGAPGKWTKSEILMFVHRIERGGTVADAARSIGKTPAEGRAFLSNLLKEHPEYRSSLHR